MFAGDQNTGHEGERGGVREREKERKRVSPNEDNTFTLQHYSK